MNLVGACVSRVTPFLVLLALVVAGCGDDDSSNGGAQTSGGGETSSASDEKAIKVAMLFTGPRTGGAFDTAGNQALKQIQDELGAEIAYAESVDLGKQVEAFADFAERGYDVVIGHSDAFRDGAIEAAGEYPDTTFVATGTGTGEEAEGDLPPNFVAVELKENEIGYLSGYVAGLVTESDKVGWIGSIPLIGIGQAMEGHKLGVADANPQAKVQTAFTDSFTDAARGKEAALTMISGGVDFLTHNADLSGLGVIEAAEQKGVPVIGHSIDQSDQAPEVVVTSVVLDFFNAYGPIVEELQGSGEVAETRRPAGVSEGVVLLAPLQHVSDEVKSEVEERVAAIEDGSDPVPPVKFVPKS